MCISCIHKLIFQFIKNQSIQKEGEFKIKKDQVMADVAKNKKTMNIVTSEVVVTDGAERGKEAVEEYEEEELGHAGEKDQKFVVFTVCRHKKSSISRI